MIFDRGAASPSAIVAALPIQDELASTTSRTARLSCGPVISKKRSFASRRTPSGLMGNMPSGDSSVMRRSRLACRLSSWVRCSFSSTAASAASRLRRISSSNRMTDASEVASCLLEHVRPRPILGSRNRRFGVDAQDQGTRGRSLRSVGRTGNIMASCTARRSHASRYHSAVPREACRRGCAGALARGCAWPLGRRA